MPKIRITQTDLTGSVQQAAISNTVFVPVKASTAFGPTVITNIEELEKGDLTYIKRGELGYVLCKHLIGIGLPILVQGVAANTNGDYMLTPTQWAALNDKNLYPIRFLTYGDLTGNRLCQDMVNVANVRKDCVALLDMNEKEWSSASYDVAKIRSNIDGAIINGEFAAAFSPWFYSKVSDLQLPTKIERKQVSAVTDKSSITNLVVEYADDTGKTEDQKYLQVFYNSSSEKIQPNKYEATYSEHISGTYVVKEDSPEDNPVYVNLSKALSEDSDSEYYTDPNLTRYMRTMTLTTDTSSTDKEYYIKDISGNFELLNKFTETYYTNVEIFEDDRKDSTGTKIPAAFGYLFAYANSIKNNPEWYAIAGFDRGIIPELSSVAYNYNASDIEILQARSKDRAVDLDDEADNVGIAINPIAYIRPAGHIIYGNRTMKSNTASKGTTATSFLNVRNLVSAVTKVMYDAAKKYTFEQNNDLLWLNFQAYVRPTLEKMKSGNGIADYTFVKEPTNAKARLKARVNIIPIEAVEDFDLSIIMTDDETLISG